MRLMHGKAFALQGNASALWIGARSPSQVLGEYRTAAAERKYVVSGAMSCRATPLPCGPVRGVRRMFAESSGQQLRSASIHFLCFFCGADANNTHSMSFRHCIRKFLSGSARHALQRRLF